MYVRELHVREKLKYLQSLCILPQLRLETDDFTQTETTSVSIQTDVVVEFKDVAVQTDIQTDCDSSQVESSTQSDNYDQLTDSGSYWELSRLQAKSL